MNFLIIIIALVFGIIIGWYLFARRDDLISQQGERKSKNKDLILNLMQANEKITNNDVEKLCEVSNATAERYLDELEKENKIVQNGKVGKGVYYTKI